MFLLVTLYGDCDGRHAHDGYDDAQYYGPADAACCGLVEQGCGYFSVRIHHVVEPGNPVVGVEPERLFSGAVQGQD